MLKEGQPRTIRDEEDVPEEFVVWESLDDVADTDQEFRGFSNTPQNANEQDDNGRQVQRRGRPHVIRTGKPGRLRK